MVTAFAILAMFFCKQCKKIVNFFGKVMFPHQLSQRSQVSRVLGLLVKVKSGCFTDSVTESPFELSAGQLKTRDVL